MASHLGYKSNQKNNEAASYLKNPVTGSSSNYKEGGSGSATQFENLDQIDSEEDEELEWMLSEAISITNSLA